MLNQYLTQTQQLLQTPNAPQTLYPTANLTAFINTARGQLAGDSESVRFYAKIPLANNQTLVPFSTISLTGSSGIQGVFNIRTLWYGSGAGQLWIRQRPFEWFSLYELNTPTPTTGTPTAWAQYGQASTGSFYVSPLANEAYTLYADCVCIPVALTSDATPEAIPYPFTDAVCYFAAYLALLSAQSQVRAAEAARMLELYTEFMNRARRYSTPSILPGIYPQNPNPVRSNQLGMSSPSGGGN